MTLAAVQGQTTARHEGDDPSPQHWRVSPPLKAGLLAPRYAGEPMDRRCWKHSRQNTGRPCVGRKGTVVSFPHCEQFVFVSERIGEACPPPPPPPSARLALQPLQRFGSFLKPLSAKNICSPAVKTNSAPHSEHFSTLSWYSMSRSPLVPCWAGGWADFVPESRDA